GCLVVEQATEARPRTNVVQRTELLTEHIETAIHNAQRYESIFLLPLWRFIGRTIGWFKGRRVWAALAIIAGIALVGAGLAYIPWEYRVEAKGLAMPVDQHEVFAPWDGDVVTVFVESGQRVEQGQKLVQLQSDELDAEKVRIVSEVNELKKTVLQREAEARSADSRPADERIRIEFEAKKAEIELEGAQDRLKVVEDRIANLLVTAPAPGVVATFQVKQLLQNRPVRRGELLMQVMDDTGEWRLELEVPEYRKGHIERAIANSGDEKLKVEYVLATAVETSHEGHVTLISNRSNQSQEEGTIVEVHAAINKEDLGNRNIGADVTAKIHCGKKNLFYVLFGDVVEFVQRYFWL
ncbi:MAG: HlyD family efflux transporter periplasmic adaptor subunit, partial [Planctomycetaceae bacterium]|nr:HlyD family efflux transporter periplasmic adaptor subunit [Planctomycetaceae bacterium]